MTHDPTPAPGPSSLVLVVAGLLGCTEVPPETDSEAAGNTKPERFCAGLLCSDGTRAKDPPQRQGPELGPEPDVDAGDPPTDAGTAEDAAHQDSETIGKADAEGPQLEAYLEELPALICNARRLCSGDAFTQELDFGDCESYFAGKFSNQVATVAPDVEAGSVQYDASRAQACLDAYGDLSCEDFLSGEFCEPELFGEGHIGAFCELHYHCQEDHYCSFDNVCPGRCALRKAAGRSCRRHVECVSGVCVEQRCVDLVDDGTRCGGADGSICRLGSHCVGATDAQPGTCMRFADLRQEELGAPCVPSIEGPGCQAGLVCALEPSRDAWFCAEPVASGAPCVRAYPSQCPPTEYCAETEGRSGICQPLTNATGQPCSTAVGSRVCQGHDYCDDAGLCRARGDNGDPCSQDSHCLSAYCAGDRCSDRCTP